MNIPFNRPAIVGKELQYIKQVLRSCLLSGDGPFTKKCSQWMEKKFRAKKILLTTSCTHALEMAALLLDLKTGDEVIVPSYTFPSTAAAFFLRGAHPIFADIRKDTLNIDERLIESKITKKTKAIFVVHYAGVGCNMTMIKRIAKKSNLPIVEDAAQGVGAQYKKKYLGTIGTFGAYSFHETKNFICGEGGALVINDPSFIERAEFIREKGTNRSKFFRGEVDKYSWVDIGSSYLPSELLAAYLFAQLEQSNTIYKKRKSIYKYYYNNLKRLEEMGLVQLPIIPSDCKSNFHLFFVLLKSQKERDQLLRYLKSKKIHTCFHYIPLHLSPIGKKLGNKQGSLPITEMVSAGLLRLPFFVDLTKQQQKYIVKSIYQFFGQSNHLK